MQVGSKGGSRYKKRLGTAQSYLSMSRKQGNMAFSSNCSSAS